jgi:hypothetical protein
MTFHPQTDGQGSLFPTFIESSKQGNLLHQGKWLTRGQMIHMDIGGHPPFPTGSKQFSDNFGNLLFLAVLTSGAILRA